jgi:hypothetical protein
MLTGDSSWCWRVVQQSVPLGPPTACTCSLEIRSFDAPEHQCSRCHGVLKMYQDSGCKFIGLLWRHLVVVGAPVGHVNLGFCTGPFTSGMQAGNRVTAAVHGASALSMFAVASNCCSHLSVFVAGRFCCGAAPRCLESLEHEGQVLLDGLHCGLGVCVAQDLQEVPWQTCRAIGPSCQTCSKWQLSCTLLMDLDTSCCYLAILHSRTAGSPCWQLHDDQQLTSEI